MVIGGSALPGNLAQVRSTAASTYLPATAVSEDLLILAAWRRSRRSRPGPAQILELRLKTGRPVPLVDNLENR